MMDRDQLRRLLTTVRDKGIDINDALEQLAVMPFETLRDARVDHHRSLRHGFSEVVFGEGKNSDQVSTIFAALAEKSSRVLATRVTEEAAALTTERVPDVVFHPAARALVLDRDPLPKVPGVAIVCAGTADLRVAEEASVTAEVMGNDVARFHDVGVSGLHRLLDVLPQLRTARVVVVVAGMEGALPSVVAGLVAVPVVAVPTSVGYGASFGGVTALLAMLNSCSSGVSVVNIDNGFGAGTVASMINRSVES